MSRALVLINGLATLKPEQSTAEIIGGLHGRGYDTFVSDPAGCEVHPDGSVWANARRVTAADPTEAVAALHTAAPTAVPLQSVDAVVVRTSPGRSDQPEHHAACLDMLDLHACAGGLVLSSPEGLRRAATKLYLAHLPAWTRPETLISGDAATLTTFVVERGRAVLKPLNGTQGRDVYLVTADDPNLSAITASLLRQGPTIAQGYVPEAPDGDIRLLLLDGELVEAGGEAAAVRRIPGKGEFRSNVHLGGRPAHAPVGPKLRALVDAVGPQLRKDGLFMVGLDVVGDKIVEANVFAPGGFSDSKRFTGVDFLNRMLDRLGERVAGR